MNAARPDAIQTSLPLATIGSITRIRFARRVTASACRL